MQKRKRKKTLKKKKDKKRQNKTKQNTTHVTHKMHFKTKKSDIHGKNKRREPVIAHQKILYYLFDSFTFVTD